MKVKELYEMMEKENAKDVEFYTLVANKKGWHTDSLDSVYEDVDENTEVLDYEFMDEEEYNNTILANASDSVDFEDVYGDKKAKVLVVQIEG